MDSNNSSLLEKALRHGLHQAFAQLLNLQSACLTIAVYAEADPGSILQQTAIALLAMQLLIQPAP